jgi:hypothetical protein
LTPALNKALTPDRIAFMHVHYAALEHRCDGFTKASKNGPTAAQHIPIAFSSKMVWRFLLQPPSQRMANSQTLIRNTTKQANHA